MSLRIQYILFIGLLHGVFVLFSLQFLPQRPWLFLLAEVLIVLSLLIAVRIFRAFIAPINLIHQGTQTLKDGDFNISLAEVGQLELNQLIKVYNHMIAQLREERVNQREQQFFLERLIEASPSGVLILNFDGMITAANPTALDYLGRTREEVLERSLDETGSPLARRLSRLGDEAQVIRLDARHTYRCHRACFMDRGFQHAFILMQELSHEIHAVEKQAYSKIIRLMSHEINNSIGAINSILKTILDYKPGQEDQDSQEMDEALTVAMERNHSLNQFVRNYADVVRLPEPHMMDTDLNALLEGISRLYKARCDELAIDWQWHLSPEGLQVRADPGQLEQVLVNVVQNAIEAVGSDGQISVHTVSSPPTLIIQDSGPAIPPEIQEQLFTPFYSSKKNGQGIGLTLTREILTNHGYEFSLGTGPDGLTEFTIRF